MHVLAVSENDQYRTRNLSIQDGKVSKVSSQYRTRLTDTDIGVFVTGEEGVEEEGEEYERRMRGETLCNLQASHVSKLEQERNNNHETISRFIKLPSLIHSKSLASRGVSYICDSISVH